MSGFNKYKLKKILTGKNIILMIVLIGSVFLYANSTNKTNFFATTGYQFNCLCMRINSSLARIPGYTQLAAKVGIARNSQGFIEKTLADRTKSFGDVDKAFDKAFKKK